MIHRMLQDLKYYHRSKEEIMLSAIQSRLDESFNVYEKELNDSLDFLNDRHELSVVKRLNKFNGKASK